MAAKIMVAINAAIPLIRALKRRMAVIERANTRNKILTIESLEILRGQRKQKLMKQKFSKAFYSNINIPNLSKPFVTFVLTFVFLCGKKR
jgi:hypothetical protein